MDGGGRDKHDQALTVAPLHPDFVVLYEALPLQHPLQDRVVAGVIIKIARRIARLQASVEE